MCYLVFFCACVMLLGVHLGYPVPVIKKNKQTENNTHLNISNNAIKCYDMMYIHFL